MEGGGALSGPGVELHESAVGRFVETIKRQPAAGGGDSIVELAQRAIPCHEPLKRAREIAAQTFCLEELPVVKIRAVAQAEAEEKIVAIECYRFGERAYARWANFRWGVTMGPALRQIRGEGLDIQPQVGTRMQAELLALWVQPGPGEGFV